VITLEQVLNAIEMDDCLGFCTKCGAEAFGVEPDARKYVCSVCNAATVYGAEELLIRGHYET
jgi:hypothetical protein